MRTLRRYLTLQLVGGWVMVFAVLAALFGLLSMINELERIGGYYTLADAAFYVGLSLPQQLLELVPVSVLLGTLLVLSSLEKSSELTIISAAGVRLGSLLNTLTVPTLLLMALLWAAPQYVTAPLHRIAEMDRITIRGSVNELPGRAVWSRDGSRYVHLGRMHEEYVPGDIDIYEFNPDGQLTRAIRAHHAEVGEDRRWVLKGVRAKLLENGQLVTRELPELVVEGLWSRQELPTLSLSAASMTPRALYDYSHYLQRTGQRWQPHALAFWKMVTLPLVAAAMILLATPLGARLGASRDSSVGMRLGLGALIGIFFYLGSQIIFALGLIFNLEPWLTSLIPIALVLAAAILLLLRMRW